MPTAVLKLGVGQGTG